MQRFQEDRGFSAWHLVLIFLGAVAVCGVFFSLGFVVGYNQGSSKSSTVAENVENVTPGSNIPPTVNPPLDTSSEPSKESITPEAAPPSPVAQPKEIHSQPLPAARAEPTRNAVRESMRNPGVRLRVERKPSGPKEARSEPPAANGRHARFAVQVIASKTKADAITLIRLLEARNYPVFLVSPKNAHAGDHLYRVQVGPYASRAQAEQARRKLEREGFKPFIVH